MSLESDGGMILTGENRRTRRKTCPSATLSTTNPTWIDPGANPGLRGERPATNDLSHGTAPVWRVNLTVALDPSVSNTECTPLMFWIYWLRSFNVDSSRKSPVKHYTQILCLVLKGGVPCSQPVTSLDQSTTQTARVLSPLRSMFQRSHHRSETRPQFSENITFFVICTIYTSTHVIRKDRVVNPVFREQRLHSEYKVFGQGGTIWQPCLKSWRTYFASNRNFEFSV